MRSEPKFVRWSVSLGWCLLVGCAANAPPPGAGGPEEGKADQSAQAGSHLVPAGERYAYYTNGEWQTKSWQWLFSMPKDHNSATDTADCSAGQSGDVWFLTGFHEEGQSTRTRSCTISPDTALYLQMNLTLGDTSPGLCPNVSGGPDFPADEAGLLACISQHAALTRVELVIDDETITIDHTSPFYVRTPWFAYVVEEGGSPLFGQPPGMYAGISEGIGALVKPFAPGSHTIHWKSTDVPGYLQDITYHLTVK